MALHLLSEWPSSYSSSPRQHRDQLFLLVRVLEQVPEELVVDFVVVLHFRRFHEGAKRTRATVGGGAFQVREACFYVGAQELGRPGGLLEIIQSGVDVVRQIPL